MKVLVAGAGAIGLWLAARLAASHDVTVLCRPVHAEAVRADGLRITGHTEFHGPVECRTDMQDAPRYELAVVTCKAHATAAVAEQVARHADVLASMQNGLGNDRKLRGTGHGRVALALTSHGCTVRGPGRVHHAGTGATVVGPGAPNAGGEEAGRVLERVLADAGLAPTWTADLEGALWQKAIVNAGINPVAAVHGVTNGTVLEDPALSAESRDLVEEAMALSRAAGVRLPTGDLVALTRGVLARTAENRCSMLQDVEARRPTEIEQITGHFIRLARRLGFPMPRSEEAYRAVKALEASYLGEAAALAQARAEAESWGPA